MQVDIEKVATQIREVAARIILPRWRNLARDEIAQKSGAGDLVTIADKEAELELTAFLADVLPGSLVVGEEGVAADASSLGRLGRQEAVWVIDPIDGTKAFADGEPEFDVMVALIRGEERIAGWIYAPVDDDMYLAERGSGVRRNGRLSNGTVPEAPTGMAVTEMTGLLGWKVLHRMRDRERAIGRKLFRGLDYMQCCGHDYARILRGESQFVLYNRAKPWDHLPGLLLLDEARYVSLRHDGSPYRAGDGEGGLGLMTAPNAESWSELRRILLD